MLRLTGTLAKANGAAYRINDKGAPKRPFEGRVNPQSGCTKQGQNERPTLSMKIVLFRMASVSRT
ncbi:MAG: hypothetical protein RLZZ182_648 [Pseudomonadota bacterium]|jgi:hypothetical protein